MPEISTIFKDTPKSITIYPWRDLDDEDFPVYDDGHGNMVQEDFGWRDIGFLVPYPTVSRLNHVQNLARDLNIGDGAAHIVSKEPLPLVKFLIYQLIEDVYGLEDNGRPINWNDKTNQYKDMLFEQFKRSSFLLGNFRTAYERAAGHYRSIEEEQDADAKKKSGSTLSDTTAATSSKSQAKKEDTVSIS